MNENKQIRIPLKPGSESAIIFDDHQVICKGVTLLYDDIVGITFFSVSSNNLINNLVGAIILRSLSDNLKIAIRNFSFCITILKK